jgi:hypothetical protein
MHPARELVYISTLRSWWYYIYGPFMATRCTVTDYETSDSEIHVSKPMIVQVKYRFGHRTRRSGSRAGCQELLQGLRLIVGGTCEPGVLPRYVSQELSSLRVDGCMLIERVFHFQ